MVSLRGLHRRAVLGVCLLLGASLPARADLIINTPGGLNPGDQFRIAFLTNGTTNGVSADIADYNTFVTNDAITQAGGVGNVVRYDTTVLTWKVIGSTTSVAAITNIGTFGVPVYLASGGLVSAKDGLGGLFGTFETPMSMLLALNQNLLGTAANTTVFTGSRTAGTIDFGLGSFNWVSTGDSSQANNSWMNDAYQSKNNLYKMYGISQVLTVPNAGPPGVPEPSTLLTAALGGLGLAVRLAWRRRPLA